MIGLHEPAWLAWESYRKSIKKPYKSPQSTELAQKRLASFGEWQMQVVEQSIERGWTGLFELPKRMVKDLKEAHRRENRDAVLLAELRQRAEKVGYRDYQPGEELASYKFLVERAERDDADRRWKDSRKGPQAIGALLGRYS